MKIATFNINNINKRLNNLIEWLRAEKNSNQGRQTDHERQLGKD